MKRKMFSVLLTLVMLLTLSMVTAAPVGAVDDFDLAVNDENPLNGQTLFTFENIEPGGAAMVFDFKLHNVGALDGILTFSMSVSENDMAGAPSPDMDADEFASLIYVEAVSYQFKWPDDPEGPYIGSVRDDLPSWLGMDDNSDYKVSLYEICQIPAIPYGSYEGDKLEATAEITYFIEFQLGGSLAGGVGSAILDDVDGASLGDGVSVTITATLESDVEVSSGNVFLAGGADSTVTMSASFTPVIGISVDPNSVDFGEVTPGMPVSGDPVTVTNTGSVAALLSAEITAESHSPVYEDGLTIDGETVAEWGPVVVAASASTAALPLVLTVPALTPPGSYTATLIFWAEMAE